MEQTDTFNYKVKTGEVVTIIFTPILVGPLADIAVDGRSLPNTGGATPTFVFTVTKGVGESHFGHARCDFPPGTPDGAKYTSTISGSMGGTFAGPTVLKTDPVNEFDLVWDVVA